MPIREQHRIPPSSSESLKVAGTCDVCGQVYQGHPNRHAMCEAKPLNHAPEGQQGESVSPGRVAEIAARVKGDVADAVRETKEMSARLDARSEARAGQQGKAKASKRPVCDTPGCGRAIPVGGEGHPEICPTCLACLAFHNEPAAPGTVSEPGKVPLSELARGIVGAEIRPWLVDGIAALEAELAEAKEESEYHRANREVNAKELLFEMNAHAATSKELAAARAEVEQLEALFQRTHGCHVSWVAEVERLRGKLAEAERERDEAKEYVILANRNRARAKTAEAAMRAAAAKVARDRKQYITAEEIERLPLSTGEGRRPAADARAIADAWLAAHFPDAENTTELINSLTATISAAQPDAIKAAVTAANNRAADAFHDWISDVAGRAAANDFEEWLRSGDPAPGTVGGGK
jgi:hypothetical protein